MSRRDEVTRSQFALRVHLPEHEATSPATPQWTAESCHRLLRVAGLGRVHLVLDAEALAGLTGRRPPVHTWGWASWGHDPALLYVDPSKARTRAATLALAAHEITHLTHHGRGYRGHSPRWFAQVQHLLDEAAAAELIRSQLCPHPISHASLPSATVPA